MPTEPTVQDQERAEALVKKCALHLAVKASEGEPEYIDGACVGCIASALAQDREEIERLTEERDRWRLACNRPASEERIRDLEAEANEARKALGPWLRDRTLADAIRNLHQAQMTDSQNARDLETERRYLAAIRASREPAPPASVTTPEYVGGVRVQPYEREAVRTAVRAERERIVGLIDCRYLAAIRASREPAPPAPERSQEWWIKKAAAEEGHTVLAGGEPAPPAPQETPRPERQWNLEEWIPEHESRPPRPEEER
jgi:hypothetical protein